MKRIPYCIAVISVVCSTTATYARISPPTQERDLVVFIADEKPSLYRLVGRQPQPYGQVQFYNPQALVADEKQQCFYVIDRPRLASETIKIWRISADGTAVLASEVPSQGGPFSEPICLDLDESGRLLVADIARGLWRMEPDGRFECLFDGKNKPMYRITATACSPQFGFVIGTSYLHSVTGGLMQDLYPERGVVWTPTPSYRGTPAAVFLRSGVGNSSGRQSPIRVWKNQGGLYTVNTQGPQPVIGGLLANREPGGEEYETYWRTLKQILVDPAGRLVLVDAGGWKSSELNGGIFLMHTDGRLEELTFKTADGSCGPLRHPHGVALWSDDTYIVADPEMKVEGVPGSGGLMLLKANGEREARWPFGQRMRPIGVAILRNAGTPAQAEAVRSIILQQLVGQKVAGPITRIQKVSLQYENPNGSVVSGRWKDQPQAAAEARLRAVFEGAQWIINPDGSLRFSGRGLNPGTQGNPYVMVGTVTQLDGMLSASAMYKGQGLFDLKSGSLDVRIHGSDTPGAATMSITVSVFTDEEHLKATFEQGLSL